MDWAASIRIGNERTSERIPKLGNCSFTFGNCSFRVGAARLAGKGTGSDKGLSPNSQNRTERMDRVLGAGHLARRTVSSRNNGVGNTYPPDCQFLLGRNSREITKILHGKTG